jgi:hypothetical protein
VWHRATCDDLCHHIPTIKRNAGPLLTSQRRRPTTISITAVQRRAGQSTWTIYLFHGVERPSPPAHRITAVNRRHGPSSCFMALRDARQPLSPHHSRRVACWTSDLLLEVERCTLASATASQPSVDVLNHPPASQLLNNVLDYSASLLSETGDCYYTQRTCYHSASQPSRYMLLSLLTPGAFQRRATASIAILQWPKGTQDTPALFRRHSSSKRTYSIKATASIVLAVTKTTVIASPSHPTLKTACEDVGSLPVDAPAFSRCRPFTQGKLHYCVLNDFGFRRRWRASDL